MSRFHKFWRACKARGGFPGRSDGKSPLKRNARFFNCLEQARVKLAEWELIPILLQVPTRTRCALTAFIARTTSS